ncbi:MAG: S8/S53 family peptidase [Gemmatimonadaceae bacterium]
MDIEPNKSAVDSLAGKQGPQGRFALSDTALWNAIKETDGIVVVGLKEVGSLRGMLRGKATIARQNWKLAARGFIQDHDLKLISIDSVRYPVVRMKPLTYAGLQRIRRLPFVDYVEPNMFKVALASGDGCSSGSSNGDDQYHDPIITLPSGDVVSATYGPGGMNVLNGWLLATGQGVTVGVTDTGLGSGNGEFDGGAFSSGQSSGRTLTNLQDSYPSCSHGTRISALATAPMNGLSTVGVAYKSNLISVKQADGEVSPGGQISAIVIDIAADSSRVVVMAWGFIPGYTPFSNLVSDAIDYHYYNRDVMFVGAAGTCPIGSSCPNMGSAVFPASKEEVLAVTAAGSDGTQPSNVYNYGSKSGITAYTGLATVGLIPGVLSIGGSSAATGFIGGAAALIRQRYPTLSARGVMDQLIQTSGSVCGAPLTWRESMVNVSAALGGPCILRFLGILTITDSLETQDYYSLVHKTGGMNAPMGIGGSGSYSAQWTMSPEQIVTDSVNGLISDSFGATYWQSRKSIRFRPAFDHLPYRSLVQMVVNDTQLGTSDPRSMSVLVCPSVTNCANTNRPYPGDPPPPPPMSASITGASSVPPSSTCNYFGAGQNGTEPYQFEWYVNGTLQSTSSTLSLSTPASGSLSIQLKVTDADSHFAWASANPPVDPEATCFDQLRAGFKRGPLLPLGRSH